MKCEESAEPKPIESEVGSIGETTSCVTGGNAGAGQSEANRKPAKRGKVRHDRTKEELFRSALTKHHKYETGGSVMNHMPASPRQIEKIAEKLVSHSTARRLLIKHFGSVEKYRDVCDTGKIGEKLVVLAGEGLHAFGAFDPSKSDVEDFDDESEE